MSSSWVSTGTGSNRYYYLVRFNRDVSGCSFQVTVGSSADLDAASPPGAAEAVVYTTTTAAETNDYVRVRIYDTQGSALTSGAAFHIAVFCPSA